MAVSLLGAVQGSVNFEAGTGLGYTAETSATGNRAVVLLWGMSAAGGRTISALTLGAVNLATYSTVSNYFATNSAMAAVAVMKDASIPVGANSLSLTLSGTDLDKGNGAILTLDGVDQSFSASLAMAAEGNSRGTSGALTITETDSVAYNAGDMVIINYCYGDNAVVAPGVTTPGGFSTLFAGQTGANTRVQGFYQIMGSGGTMSPVIDIPSLSGNVPSVFQTIVIPAAGGSTTAPLAAAYYYNR
jgi:hypothetical protein